MVSLLVVAAPALLATSTDLLTLCKSVGLPKSGYVCGPAAARRIDAACAAVEADGVKPSFPRDLMAIDGEWRLLYSSTLAGSIVPEAFDGLIGTLRAPLAESPLAPREVTQKIDVTKRRCVNALSLSPWPGGAVGRWLRSAPLLGDVLSPLQPAKVQLELDHTFSVEGEGGAGSGGRKAAAGSVMNLNLERVRRTLADMSASAETDRSNSFADLIPRESDYELPSPLAGLVAGSFDTTFVDETVRISRGVSSVAGAPPELRVFERISGSGKKIYRSWQEEEDALAAAAAAGEELDAIEDRWQEGGLDEVESAEGFLEGDDDVPD